MDRSVIFVHGTGVRDESFEKTFTLIDEAFTTRRPGMLLRGCYWGGEFGARLHMGGASIPHYRERSRKAWPEVDPSRALWTMLRIDPWYELRILGLSSDQADSAGVDEVALEEQRRRAQGFRVAVRSYEPSSDLVDALRKNGLDAYFLLARRALLRSPEFVALSRTVGEQCLDEKAAVARALIGFSLAAAEAEGAPSLDGTVRARIVAKLTGELSAQHRGGLAEKFKSAVLSPPAHLADWYFGRSRGPLTDAATPLLGDILLYQARGDGVRAWIQRSIEDTPGDAITVIGHSLGGIACTDLLVNQKVPRVDQLITVGSQVSYLHEIGALTSLLQGQPLPEHFPAQWLNVYDEHDPLSHPAAPVFGNRVHDVQVDNGELFLAAHSAYWSNAKFWDSVMQWIG